MTKKAFWAKVLLIEDFVAYFYGKTDEQISQDINASIVDIMAYQRGDFNPESKTFGALLIKKAEMIMQMYAEANKGKNGGRPKKNKDKPVKEVAKKDPVKKYGTYHNVALTDEEYLQLSGEIQGLERFIEELSSYMASSGKYYKNFVATIRNWAKRSQEYQCQKQQKSFQTQERERASQIVRNNFPDIIQKFNL